jgi:hypothetical protein
MEDKVSELLRESEIVELYRALGDDLAGYGLHVPADAPDSLLEGYRAGAARHARPRAADGFVRKCLQLRYQALARRRAVSHDVTVEFIRFLDVSVCPVTLLTLTHGELTPTDWSIDRLNNNGAYTTTNLAVISTHANRSKGAKGFAEVRRLSEAASPAEGLTPQEWTRMAATMFGPCYFEDRGIAYYMRQVAPLPEPAIRVPWQVFQDYLVRAALGLSQICVERFPTVLAKLPNNQSRGMAKRLIQLIQAQAGALSSPFDVWFDDDLFGRYKTFYLDLLESTGGETLRVLGDLYDKIPISERIASELRFPDRGHLN